MQFSQKIHYLLFYYFCKFSPEHLIFLNEQNSEHLNVKRLMAHLFCFRYFFSIIPLILRKKWSILTALLLVYESERNEVNIF